MNAISFKKGKIAFQLFLIVLFQWTSTSCQLNLYNTDQTFKSNSLQFDCLNYHVRREEWAYHDLSDIVDEVIPYCFRPSDNFDESSGASVDPLSQKLSFEQMRTANITSLQLLSWSIPIEVAERYQFYLNEPNSALNEYFYNCSEGRFGLRCQYSFDSHEGMSFDEIVEADFHERIGYYESSNMMVQAPCYVLLNCHRDGQVWCLDWREVCDGKVDCFDEGTDEESCFDMELNECGEDEYRCHNGLCISQDFWEDGVGDTDCLDRSDTAIDSSYIDSCFQDPTFRCEEHSCRTNVNPFSCGDGQCVLTFEECHNGRHVLLINSMTVKGNLTNTSYTDFEQCELFFEFPTIPVYSDHIQFRYKNLHLRSSTTGLLLPDYVCRDENFCDFIIPSLYNCQNVSKFISKHRIMDNMIDYWYFDGDDDENYAHSIDNNTSNRTCICPPSCDGHLSQYQNQRISLTLRLSSNDQYATYAIISMLIDDDNERQEIDAYDQFVYIAKQNCSITLNRYLLFSTRPKHIYKNYSVRIDAFEKNTMTYVGSWHFPITFLFLAINRVSISLNLSNHLLQRSTNCSVTCQNGECMKYVNKNEYFCRCFPKWSGIQCNIPMNCQECSSDSTCIGLTNNQSICPINACQNNGQCVPDDVSIPENTYTCICPVQFFGQHCEHRKAKLDVSLNKINIPSYLVAYFFTLYNKTEPIETTILRKLTLFQHSVIFHIAVPFQLAFIQASDKYYLAAFQQFPIETSISTSISPKQECKTVEQINSTVSNMFHDFCRTDFNLICFIDKNYLCLCTIDHHANCMKFNGERNFQCPLNDSCTNEGQCLQDHPTYPLTKICVCPSCFFGDRCQFYAKGLGSTLDEILGYEIKRNALLSNQPATVKVGAAITMLIFLIGIISSILSIIIFLRKKSQEVGCGIYLLASSITSLFIMILFTLKFWFLFYSHQNINGQQHIIQANCFGIEPLLKVFLYLNNWLNACVAVERTMSIFQGINFNKNRSRRVARWITLLLFLTIPFLLIPQLIYLHIFTDEFEERSWCVVKYAPWLQTYSSTLLFFHYFAPLSINIFSAIFIVLASALQRARAQTDRNFLVHLKSKLKEHKHILISSAIIICFTLPYLIISIKLDCKKSSDLFWFYFIGYFLSFFPATFMFIIFVLPSSLYRKELTEIRKYIRRRYEIFKLNRSRL